jgi:mannose-1-phosphate guanylyltransferase
LASWEYLWNAGYFIFSAKSFLDWTKKLAPKVYKVVSGKYASDSKEMETAYKALDNEPVEPVIVEKLGKDKRLVIPSKLQWSDVGNWGSLYDFLKDSFESSMIVKGNHIDEGSKGCFIHSEKRLVATVGLRDTIVIETEDAILVADRNNVSEVKKIIEKLKEQGKMLYL